MYKLQARATHGFPHTIINRYKYHQRKRKKKLEGLEKTVDWWIYSLISLTKKTFIHCNEKIP